MTDLIRGAALTHFADTARSVGLQPAKMLSRIGLRQANLNNPDARIAVSGMRLLLETCAATASVEDFGLRLAERGGLSILGPVALVVREQPTLGEAMTVLSRYVHIHNGSVKLRIERHKNFVSFVVDLLGSPNPAPQAAQFALGLTHRILVSLAGNDWRPLGVQIVSMAPHDPEPYRRFFKCRVTFGAELNAVVCAVEDLERPIFSADASIARYAQNYIESLSSNSHAMDDKVRELILALLPTGHCTIERVAEHLLCDRRTIHRHLSDCGTSYSEILDSVRADMAIRLINDPSRSMPAVAELLGFSAQSALARWFKERFKCSITQWRLKSYATENLAARDTSRLLRRRRRN